MIKRVLPSILGIFCAFNLFSQTPSLVKNINVNASTGCQPGEVTKAGNVVFFRANDQASTNPDFELWRTDATNAGTVKISINSGASGFPKNGKGLGASNEYFVFNGVGVGTGSELFIYNVNLLTYRSGRFSLPAPRYDFFRGFYQNYRGCLFNSNGRKGDYVP